MKKRGKMKKVFIVHGWSFNPKMNWYPWLKRELEKKRYKVVIPKMPNTSEPQIKEWVSHLKKVVDKLDEDTYFVGHSIGCQTIMRFLEKEDYNSKLPKVVFVAGWFKLNNLEDENVESIAKPWLETTIDFEKVKQKIRKLIVFLSSNEPYDCLKENEVIFKDKLGANIIMLKNRGHFTEDDGIMDIPEILNEF